MIAARKVFIRGESTRRGNVGHDPILDAKNGRRVGAKGERDGLFPRVHGLDSSQEVGGVKSLTGRIKTNTCIHFRGVRPVRSDRMVWRRYALWRHFLSVFSSLNSSLRPPSSSSFVHLTTIFRRFHLGMLNAPSDRAWICGRAI